MGLSLAGTMSGMLAFGIILIVVSSISIAIVAVMFWWAAREDGRDQERTDARLGRSRPDEPRDVPPRP